MWRTLSSRDALQASAIPTSCDDNLPFNIAARVSDGNAPKGGVTET